MGFAANRTVHIRSTLITQREEIMCVSACFSSDVSLHTPPPPSSLLETWSDRLFGMSKPCTLHIHTFCAPSTRGAELPARLLTTSCLRECMRARPPLFIGATAPTDPSSLVFETQIADARLQASWELRLSSQ